MSNGQIVPLRDAIRACYEEQTIDGRPGSGALVARLMGVKQQTVSKWVTGENEPDLATIAALEALCGRPRGWILSKAGFAPPLTPALRRLTAERDGLRAAALAHLEATALRSGIDDPRSAETRRRLAALVGVTP